MGKFLQAINFASKSSSNYVLISNKTEYKIYFPCKSSQMTRSLSPQIFKMDGKMPARGAREWNLIPSSGRAFSLPITERETHRNSLSRIDGGAALE